MDAKKNLAKGATLVWKRTVRTGFHNFSRPKEEGLGATFPVYTQRKRHLLKR